jgi:excisionase family DNA binding protein
MHMSDSFFEKPRSIPELAAYLDTTTRYISGQIAKGNLRAIKFSNNLVRLNPSDILEWMDSRASRPIKEAK